MIPRNEEYFLAYIDAAIRNDKLVLPTLPEVALNVRQAINKDDASDGELAKLIASDPALSARLLQVANSPLYRGRQKIENIQAAITRMGRGAIRTLITSLAMRQVFRPKILMLEEYFISIWQHSANISAMSRVLAARFGRLDKEQAMLAGLIHQIGKLPILTLAEKFPELAQDKPLFDKLLETFHPAIGKTIMETWDMPESFRGVAWKYNDYQWDSGPEVDYVDIVQVAHLESEMMSTPSLARTLADIPAFRKLGLDPQIEVLEIEGVAEEISEIKQIFV